MKVQLPDGSEIHVMFKHEEVGPPRENLPSGVYHKTSTAIKFPDGTVLEGATTCSPFDQFNKTEGRRRALNRAFAKDSAKHLKAEYRFFLVRRFCGEIFKPRPSPKVARAAVAALTAIRDMRDRVANGTADLPVDQATGSPRAFDDWAADVADSVLAKLKK